MHHLVDRIHDLVAVLLEISGDLGLKAPATISINSIDVVLGTVIFILPIRMIIRLQMSYQRKVILCFGFSTARIVSLN